ncbi:probable 2-oxoglutarate-dependent dioxygenase aop1 [Phtheirospermum japonicum]|uniref:Probable 2-oxoglutarate-dependent dioxygenase aop1 n=1 Tax=Phtheirospermum japonicum TaxID=374723 RepID=A0A830CJU9_9LAMI|nr:probable 2-oxoglutarate-dependent dioxygenase aop1 [Phtheirospermum japonicum]
MRSLANPTLPTIDFSDTNIVPGSPSWLSTSKDVVRALEDYGCFIAVNYGSFSLDLHEAIFGAAKELFDLPTDVKVKNTSVTPSHGYVGQMPQIPLYEGLGIENSITREGVEKFNNLLWPSGNPRFCETSLEYSKVVAELDGVVMRMVSRSYGIENSYETLVGATSYLLRMIKYRVPQEDETSLGIVPHTDKSFMTILHQRQVRGLQVKTKNCDDWIVVDPSPSSFIVMAGDACMGWTNGRIEPSQHRVIIKGKEERYSVGLFTFIKDVKIKVPAELVDDEHPLRFKPFDHYKYIHFYYTEEGKRSKCPIKAYCGI